MKTIRHALIALFLGATILLSSCATNGYWADRRRDALDVFTVQAGYMLGAKARVGCIQTGLLMDIGAGGLRGGEFLGASDFWPEGYRDGPCKMEVDLVGIGGETFIGNETANRRGKSFGAMQYGFFSYPVSEETLSEGQQEYFGSHHVVRNPAPYFTEVEVAVDAPVGLRLGFNPGELLDFVLGWVGIDIYHDDLSKLPPPEKPKGEDDKHEKPADAPKP